MNAIEIATSLIAQYIERRISATKGNVISIDVKRISKWYREAHLGREMPRKIKCAVIYVLKQLHKTGHVEKIGDNYVIRKGSKMWTPEIENLINFIRSAIEIEEVVKN